MQHFLSFALAICAALMMSAPARACQTALILAIDVSNSIDAR